MTKVSHRAGFEVDDDTATCWLGRGPTRSSLSVTRHGQNVEGRTVYTYEISTPVASESGNDLSTGVGIDHGPLDMLGTLLSFLGAAAESYRYEMDNPGSSGENTDLFSTEIVEWAYRESDELGMLQLEIEGNDE